MCELRTRLHASGVINDADWDIGSEEKIGVEKGIRERWDYRTCEKQPG